MPSKRKPIRRFFLRHVIPPFGTACYRALGSTWRYNEVRTELAKEALCGDVPVVVACLHSRCFLLLYYNTSRDHGQLVSMEYGYGALGELTPLYTASYAHNVIVADDSGHAGSAGAIQIGDYRESNGSRGLQWIDADSTRVSISSRMRLHP